MYVGLLFGIAFVKAEIISWYRIQEMFRLQSFHMYLVVWFFPRTPPPLNPWEHEPLQSKISMHNEPHTTNLTHPTLQIQQWNLLFFKPCPV